MKKIVSKYQELKRYHYPTPSPRDNTIYKYCAAKPGDGLNEKTPPAIRNVGSPAPMDVGLPYYRNKNIVPWLEFDQNAYSDFIF